ncbi:hypothetical protein FRC04_011710 [Tulasnella sp. 424]|nr:hypothetical protein FRC04_011710 [Tulasnella sp. 424]KAG8978056.1 hypothetical protein FRC05_011171 [Tulasnella sp. 425]
MSASAILKRAFPLIPTHGFTRTCIAEASALSDTAITALFGKDDEAERVLVDAWLTEGVKSMPVAPASSTGQPQPFHTQLKTSLGWRLRYNEPVLKHLPEAFAVLGTQTAVIPYDPRPAFEHAFRIADEALHVSGDSSLGPQWYARRAAVALAYSAAGKRNVFYSPHLG